MINHEYGYITKLKIKKPGGKELLFIGLAWVGKDIVF
jgi:hypothetical protein